MSRQVDLSMWIKNDSHQKGPIGHEVVVYASIGAAYGFAKAPLGEMPVELLRADFEEFCAHEWAAPMIAEAIAGAKAMAREMASVVDLEVA